MEQRREPEPRRSLGRRVALAAGTLAASAVAVVAGAWLAIEGDGNVHVVQEGVVIRSAQPSAARLDEIVRRYHVRSVLNLRGANAGRPWYDEEIAASRAHGLQHLDVALSARRDMTPAQVAAVLKMVADAPKPVLIHCNGGSDRTGLISAAWQWSQSVPAPVAEGQLSIRYGHFPWLGSRTSAMDRSLAALEAAGTSP